VEKKQAAEVSNELCDLRGFGLNEIQSLCGTQYNLPDLREPHEWTLTDRGRTYQLEIYAARKKEVETKLRKCVGRIYTLLDSHPGSEVLEKERDVLDAIKEEFNQAYQSFKQLLQEESTKVAAYLEFDLCDREFTECRMRLTKTLHSIKQPMLEEFKTSRQETKSTKLSHSGRTKASGSSRSFRSSVMSKRVDTAARAVKLEVEMKYLEHKTNLRKIQLEKEIALADDEEEAIKLVMNEGAKDSLASKDMKLDEKCEESTREAKLDARETVIKHEPSMLTPEALPFEPLTSRNNKGTNQDNYELCSKAKRTNKTSRRGS